MTPQFVFYPNDRVVEATLFDHTHYEVRDGLGRIVYQGESWRDMASAASSRASPFRYYSTGLEALAKPIPLLNPGNQKYRIQHTTFWADSWQDAQDQYKTKEETDADEDSPMDSNQRDSSLSRS
jgi:hypothetical protein